MVRNLSLPRKMIIPMIIPKKEMIPSITQIPPVVIVVCPLGRRGGGSCQNDCVILLTGKIATYVRTEGSKNGEVTL